MADDEVGPEDAGDGDWALGEMTMEEYRRMAERIKAEGREAFSADELARFDAAHQVNVSVSADAQRAAARLMPDLSEAVRKVRETALESMTSQWRQDAEDSLRERMSTSLIEPPQVDEELWDSLAEAKEEERAQREAEVRALESIAGHMAEMKAEQKATSKAAQATTAEVGNLRADGQKTGRWTIGLGVVSAVAASVAAVFAVLVFLFPPG
ncbi:hypothetical protein [Brachybacterium sp. AG952]|uniref:hypothetical protein n=1 Tax=Brachybacterium sp. AG952 TaxID=2183989 RepID=UPI00105D5A22|nr:hypothetical protein [Brachybacterium sp. AG952]